VNKSGGPLFGLGLGIGIAAGFILGSMVAARVWSDAAETLRSVSERVLHRGERIRFEALLQ